MISRLLAPTLASSPKSFLLLGPRQVGKSTLIRSLNPDIEINLANRGEFLDFSSNPRELEQRLLAQPVETVFIDEVQKLPSILDTIQTIIDDKKKYGAIRFYLTGSSARKLKRGGANLLPGRVFTYHLGPIASCEAGYNLDGRIGTEIGFLPEPLLSKQRSFQEKLLSSYASTYLAEEIQAEALTRNLEGFSRFIHIAAAVSGSPVDFSKVASRAKISRHICTRFFQILEDTLVAKAIFPCEFVQAADLVKHPKYYFFDVGVLNGILGNFTASPDRIGLLTEHLVFNQLIQSAQANDKAIEVSSFRTRGGLEIDFIVRIDKRVWAIEVKTSANISTTDLAGIKAFARYFHGHYEGVVAVLDGREKKIDGVRVLPWQKLLKEMGL